MPIAPKSTEEKTSRRDAVAAAVEKNGITDEDVTPEAAAAAAAEAEGEEAQAAEGEAAGEANAEAEAVGGAKGEDAAGKDKTAGKKADAKAAKPGEQAKPEAAGKDKPPQGWSPAARELWGKVPPEVKGEIARREKDNAKQAEQLSMARQFIDPVQKALTPFVPLAKALGTSPLALAHDGLQLAAGLRAGDNERKGELIGQLIKRFGGPAILQNINDALVKLGIAQPAEEESAAAEDQEKGGNKKPAPAPQQAVYKDPRLDEFLAEREKEKQRREEQSAARAQQLQDEADREIEKFADEHEFYEDVRLKMKSLYDGGIAKDLEEAYEMALKLDGKIQGILSQRDAAEKAKDKTTSVQRAKTAGSSVKSSPAGAGGAGKPKGIRAALDAAWDGLSGRT